MNNLFTTLLVLLSTLAVSESEATNNGNINQHFQHISTESRITLAKHTGSQQSKRCDPSDFPCRLYELIQNIPLKDLKLIEYISKKSKTYSNHFYHEIFEYN